MIFFFVWKTDEIPAQIIGVLFGTIVTAVVTLLLLSAQTDSEEKHEVSGKIFDKKTEAYLQVLESLENIISDGKVDTIRDNKLSGKEDEFSKLLFELTLLSSFVETKKDSETYDMNSLINAITEIIKTTTSEGTRIPEADEKNFWNGNGKKNPNETQKIYYSELAKNLKEISRFAAKNIQRGSDKIPLPNLNLEKLISDSGLFPEKGNVETKALISNNANSQPKEESLDFRKTCLADCLEEMRKQLVAKFGNAEREGNAGDDYYWGRWKDKDTTVETITDWLLDKPRRSEIGYKVDFPGGYSVEFCIYGDAKTFCVYVFASKDMLEKAESKRETIKKDFNNGWWIPDSFAETGWIVGGCYGGDYNGVNLSFDFRNGNNLSKIEYEVAYQKFKENAIHGIISGRDDSIERTVEQLKKVIEG